MNTAAHLIAPVLMALALWHFGRQPRARSDPNAGGPRYPHEHDRRLFLGRFGRFDLYVYAGWTKPVYEARSRFRVLRGDGNHPALAEARRRSAAERFAR